MKVVIFGATGMVGKGVLLECLADARVEHVLLCSRHPIDVSHPKIREIVHTDFADFGSIQEQFIVLDACFYCLGVSAVGLSESQYHHLTYDLTLAAATALASATAGRLTFCYVSGEGTDGTERGRTMWARVKGKTENALLRLPFKAALIGLSRRKQDAGPWAHRPHRFATALRPRDPPSSSAHADGGVLPMT
jgi:nucleoside-diphosphate-sugar epimerase